MLNPGDFDFELPDELIARYPASPRDSSRLLQIDRISGHRAHRRFEDLPDLLQAGDCLVLNDSKVLPARLYGRVENREVELLLIQSLDDTHLRWRALGRPGRKLKPGTTVEFARGGRARVVEKEERQLEVVFEISPDESFYDWLQQAGKIPLPPYLKREAEAADNETYQTVYARHPGSVAAPTAGLHFTPALFQRCETRGIRIAHLTLHVGYGTFAPLEAGAERLHQEIFEIPDTTLNLLEQTRSQGGRIVAVGTTTCRVLESYGKDGVTKGQTDLFIRPGHPFLWVDGLVTNFHLPQSSLLVLVASLAGKENTLAAYREAVERGYRFYSYGDAMLIL